MCYTCMSANASLACQLARQWRISQLISSVQESDSDSIYKLNENHTQYYKQLRYLLIDILIYIATQGTQTTCSRVKSTYHKSIIFYQDVKRPPNMWICWWIWKIQNPFLYQPFCCRSLLSTFYTGNLNFSLLNKSVKLPSFCRNTCKEQKAPWGIMLMINLGSLYFSLLICWACQRFNLHS